VVLLLAAMTGLASFWNWCKHAHPRLARGTMIAAWAGLIYRLL